MSTVQVEALSTEMDSHIIIRLTEETLYLFYPDELLNTITNNNKFIYMCVRIKVHLIGEAIF